MVTFGALMTRGWVNLQMPGISMRPPLGGIAARVASNAAVSSVASSHFAPKAFTSNHGSPDLKSASPLKVFAPIKLLLACEATEPQPVALVLGTQGMVTV